MDGCVQVGRGVGAVRLEHGIGLVYGALRAPPHALHERLVLLLDLLHLHSRPPRAHRALKSKHAEALSSKHEERRDVSAPLGQHVGACSTIWVCLFKGVILW